MSKNGSEVVEVPLIMFPFSSFIKTLWDEWDIWGAEHGCASDRGVEYWWHVTILSMLTVGDWISILSMWKKYGSSHHTRFRCYWSKCSNSVRPAWIKSLFFDWKSHYIFKWKQNCSTTTTKQSKTKCYSNEIRFRKNSLTVWEFSDTEKLNKMMMVGPAILTKWR